VKVLGISGSLREGSHNTALLRAAQRVAPEGMQLELYEELELIPPYNEDRDGDAAPAAATRLRELVAGADAVLFATPEYNGSTPGQLKNALDWLSRPRGDAAIFGKTAAVVGASTGAYGGVWAQADLRKSLGIAGARLVQAELALGHAGDHLYDDGEIADSDTHDKLAQVLIDIVETAEPAALAA
jgi:chromate reductase, NAD(P)H dehydrogenase (quinone)